jgi:hypothetical protein
MNKDNLFLLLHSLTMGYRVILHLCTNIHTSPNIPFGFFLIVRENEKYHAHTHKPPLVLVVLKLKFTILIVPLLTLLTNF